MATDLILIRHGATRWNRQKRYCGFRDISLSPQGKKQVKQLCAQMSGIKASAVYCSDRTRAIETARIIFKRKKLRKIKDLREMNFGVFEGLTYAQAREKYPRIYGRWLNDPFSIALPKGEHLNNFKQRVVKALAKIIRDNKDTSIAVVCHGGTIGIFISHILDKKEFWKHIPKPASLTRITIDKGKASVHG
jgi:broad specificity phosphatase PhoE